MSPAEGTERGIGHHLPAFEWESVGWKGRDALVLAVVPVVLVCVSLLPASLLDTWRLAFLEPTLQAAYLSHFVHAGPDHLASNLLGYALLAPLAYVLCVSAGRRLEFMISFVTFLIAFPLALSALNVALVRPSVGYGFSGIVMALLGLLTLSVCWHVEDNVDAGINAAHAPIGFFLVAGIIAVIAVPLSTLSLAAAGLATVALFVYLGSAVRRIEGLWSPGFRHDSGFPEELEFQLAGVLVAVVFPFAAFPADPTGSGTVLNLYEHVLGFCLGFIVPFVTFTLLDWIGPSGKPIAPERRDG